MILSYKEAVEWMKTRKGLGIKPGLERMEWMLEKCGNPERRLKTVHIAGTNGKGSTLVYLRDILLQAGYVVGSFTSPSLTTINDQIQLDKNPLPEEEFMNLLNEIIPIIEEAEGTEHGSPTEFEILTLIAILYFAKVAYPDIVLMEAGMGGGNDSTNVIHPLLSIITNVSYDHMDMLGDTIEKIASEKAGIIKPGVPVITGADKEEALDLFRHVADDNKSKLYEFGKHFTVFDHSFDEERELFSYRSSFNVLDRLTIRIPGNHQVRNSAVAIMASDFLKNYYSFIIEESHIRKGLETAVHPGRFEKLSDSPLVILDGAHNEAAIASLVETLESRVGNKQIHVVFGALKTKDAAKMTELLESVAERITYTSFEHPYASKAEELYNRAGRTIPSDYSEDWRGVFRALLPSMKQGEILLITGSLYFLSEVRGWLLYNLD